MARKLYGRLQVIFNDIREVTVSLDYRSMRERNIIIKDRALLSDTHYDAVAGAEQVAQTVLDIVRSSVDVLQNSLIF